jgi:hypothetical protein
LACLEVREGNGLQPGVFTCLFLMMEEALELIYRGQCNVAVKAKEIGVSTEELKRLFRVYAMQRPIDDDVWRGDVELGWPWV